MADFNTSPYFDDFDEAKKFLKILFRPGYAVQTRELNQAQTILQNQFDRFGKHIFKEGAMVIPGNLSVNTNTGYVKLIGATVDEVVTVGGVDATAVTVSDYLAAAADLVGKRIVGESTGVEGIVKWYQAETTTTPFTIFVDYDKSGTFGGVQVTTFGNAETLSVVVEEEDDENYTSYKLVTAATGATGTGSIAAIERGIYFTKGHFVQVSPQTIVLSAYSALPSYRVGLDIVETFVTPEDDISLTDNATGSFNESAPGAHRYKIELELKTYGLDENAVGEFIELIQVEDGVTKRHVNKTEYSELEKTLARRTYDESGSYTVTPFPMKTLEARTNDRGEYTNSLETDDWYYLNDIVESEGNFYMVVDFAQVGDPGRDGTNPRGTPGTLGAPTTSNTPEGTVYSDGGVKWMYVSNPVFNGGHRYDGLEENFVLSIDPGKAYVRGYEIEKPGTTYLHIPKAREYETVIEDLIPTTIGNYVKVANVVGVPDFIELKSVNLYSDYDSTAIGTANIRSLERDFDSTWKLYLFNVNLDEDKSFANDVVAIGNSEFDCICVNTTQTFGLGYIAELAANGDVTGAGTQFTRDFVVGNVIEIAGGYFVIDSVDDDNTMTVLNPDNLEIDNAPYKYFTSGIVNPDGLAPLFSLGHNAIKQLKDDDDNWNLSYYTMQKYTFTTTSGQTSVTITLDDAATEDGVSSVATQLDPNAERGEYLVCETGVLNAPVTGATITMGAVDPVSGLNRSFVVSGLTQSTEYTVFFPAVKMEDLAAAKTKTLHRYVTLDIEDQEDFQKAVISLQKADVAGLVSVYEATSSGTYSAVGAKDITNYWNWDTGQRPGYYGIGTISRRQGFPVPQGTLRIAFAYFEHSDDGDYFSVDSYTNVLRNQIPYYNNIPLADVMDFRPRLSDDGTTFDGTGSSNAQMPKPGTPTEITFQYYLSRIDKIAMAFDGRFPRSVGVAAEYPKQPQVPNQSMHMATLGVDAYTGYPEDMEIKRIDNRRYTMRDIGALEKRIEGLEYYTSLSLLEQRASSLSITDNETGLNRFKNGFIVDNFAGHQTGDSLSGDYKCSIDMEERELRPAFTMDNINLMEVNDRQSGNYQVTGDLITLPYNEIEFISQTQCSTVENVNPFAVFTFIGEAALNPTSDEWFETQRLPDIVNDLEGDYNAVLAANADQLGTVWNSWQTQWTGTTTSTEMMAVNQRFSKEDFGLGAGRWMPKSSFTAAEKALIGSVPGRRVITYETTATQEGQTRTGIKTEIKATFNKELVGNKLVSQSVIPYIRARNVVFLARGLRLNTEVNAFFEGVNVDDYITPASRIEFSGLDPVGAPLDIGLFDYETNVGSENDEVAREFDGKPDVAYNKGDVIYVSKRGTSTYSSANASPATAVCVLQEVQPGGSTRGAQVLNVVGDFQVGDEITGTISGTKALVVSYTAYSAGDTLETNFGGDVAGVFALPNNDRIKFNTGTREFKLIDNLDNNDAIAETRAYGTYYAKGLLNTQQATYNSIRNAEIVQTEVSEDRTLTLSSETRAIRDTGWYDPLAQTFLVQNKGGCFITSVDVWFASVDPIKPISVQIREVVNGYPGKVILPFSNVTLQPYELRDENQPAGFGLSSNTVTLTDEDGDQNVWLAPDKPTRIRFKAPIFLKDVGEYCVVLLSNSNLYNVWISEIGGVNQANNGQSIIAEQPYMGVLFKSQNSSTWTAHQNQDLMFRLNRAEFTSSGSVTFTNSKNPLFALSTDPFETKINSKLVRVYQKNHGFNVGDEVTISSVASGTYNGFTDANLNGTHDVLHVSQDTYMIRMPSLSTKSGFVGGSGAYATKNIKFDVVQPIVSMMDFDETNMSFGLKPTSARSIHGIQSVGTQPDNFISVIPNESNVMSSTFMAASPDNEQLYLEGDKSVQMQVNMSTANSSISPVIDTARLSLAAINNKINNPTYTNMNFVGEVDDGNFDAETLVSATDNLTFSGDNMTVVTDDATDKAAFNLLRPGTLIRFDGSTSNDGVYEVVSVSADLTTLTLLNVNGTLTNEAAGQTVALSVYNNYVSEAVSNGSASARYLTKKILLDNAAAESSNINIRFAADVPVGAFIDVYYKTALTSSSEDFNDIKWVLHDTVEKTIGLTDHTFDVENIDPFDAVAVKLVMRSSNSALVPIAKELIIVATA